MAPLTWRNVDSPSFASANQLYSLAGKLMNDGFDRAGQGIKDFRTTTTEEQSAGLMADVIAAGGDPDAIAAAVAGRNSNFLSPTSLSFANDQPGELLDRQGQALQNTGYGLNNTRTGNINRREDYDFGQLQTTDARDEANRVARPEAITALGELRGQMASNDPAMRQQAEARTGAFIEQYGAALGIDSLASLNAFNTGNDADTAQQRAGVQAGIDNASTLDNQNLSQEVQTMAADVLAQNGGDVGKALEAANAFTGMDPQKQMALVNALTEFGGVVTGGTPSILDDLSREYGIEVAPTSPNTYTPTGQGNRASSMLQDSVNQATNQATAPVASAVRASVSGAEGSVQSRFMGAIMAGGVSNPYALAAIASTGQRESNFTARNASGTWDDASETGRPGTAGGIMSWNNERYQNMLAFTGGNLSPENQAAFMLSEDPELINALNNSKSVEESQQLMNNAWRFAGYNREGGEAGERLNTAKSFLNGTGVPAQGGNGAVSQAPTGPSGSTGPANAANPNAATYEQMMNAAGAGEDWQAPAPENGATAEDTISRQIGGTWFNVPTTIGGQSVPEDVAMEEFRKGNNPAVGAFQSRRAAESAAETRSGSIDKLLEDATKQAETNTTRNNDQLTQAFTPAPASSANDNSINIEDYPSAFTSNEEGLQFMVDQGIYPEGTSLRDVGQAPAGTSIAQAATNRLDTLRAQTSNPNAEIRVNGDITIPSVPLSGTRSQRDRAAYDRGQQIDSAVASIGSSIGGGNTGGSAWDYFMTEDSGSNGAAENWYASNEAGDFFRENPNELTAAMADPEGYANRYASDQAETADFGMNDAPSDAAPESGNRPLRDLDPEETLTSYFDEVENYFRENDAAEQYSGVTRIIEDGTYKDMTASQIAQTMVAEGGSYAGQEAGDIDNAIQEIMDEFPGMTAPVASGVLGYSTSYERTGLFNLLSERTMVDMAAARRVASQFRTTSASGVASYNRSIDRMGSRDLSRDQEEKLTALRSSVETNEAALLDIIKNSPQDADRAKEILAVVRRQAIEQLDRIATSGGNDANLRSASQSGPDLAAPTRTGWGGYGSMQ
jgi:hypothetical protein